MGEARPRPARIDRAPANRLVRFILLLCAISLTGCGKEEHITKPIVTPPRYPALSTPQNVMIALATAYSGRDSVEYGLLFDDNYVGTSTDYQSPSPPTLTFTKADELAHIGALARSPTITKVSLAFSPNLSRSGADSAGWVSIQPGSILLEIDDSPNSYSLSPYGESMEFKFVPTTPAPTSPTDTTWKIIRWYEILNP